MARYVCVRCGKVEHVPDPHICKDVQQRYDEAVRRANVPCVPRKGTRLDGYLLRMAHDDPHGKPPRRTAYGFVVDGHGHLLDPAADELDDVARAMLDGRGRPGVAGSRSTSATTTS